MKYHSLTEKNQIMSLATKLRELGDMSSDINQT